MMIKRAGYTLLELSIVLVIISLIVGGIFVGREIIETSKLRNTLSQLALYDGAFAAFITKYNCLPGDCANASNLSLNFASQANNGDGNGKIDALHIARASAAGNERERFNAWVHLERANLIKGTFSGTFSNRPATLNGFAPPIAYGRNGYVLALSLDEQSPLSYSDGTTTVFGNAYALMGSIKTGWPTELFTPNEAMDLDMKIDDGMPNTGIVRHYFVSGGNEGTIAYRRTACITPGPAGGFVYDIQAVNSAGDQGAVECLLLVKANW